MAGVAAGRADLTTPRVLNGSVDRHERRDASAARADQFTDASQGAARGPSIAFGFIPCPWGPTGLVGLGEAYLDGGGPPSSFGPDRHPHRDYLEIGRAANDLPTTWTLAGEAAGLMPWPFHLIVVELP